MATNVPSSFAFIPADGFGRAKATDRRLIRSHCMKGKNKKKATQAAAFHVLPTSNDIPRATKSLLLKLSDLEPSKLNCSCDPLHWDVELVGDKAEIVSQLRGAAERAYIIPRPPPTDLSLVKFAGEVDGYSRELLFKFFIVARHVAFPVDSSVDFDFSKNIWFQWLSDDVAYFHSVLLSTSVIHDFVMLRPPAKTTFFHLRKTIAFLNEHLSDSSLSLRDSTIAVVITLAMLADVYGDYAAARAHIAGLKEMVRLRGGLEAFRDNSKLHIKIRRLDLSLSLNTGERPHFLTDPISWAPIFEPVPDAEIAERLGDHRLAVIFRDLQYFAGLMNTAAGGTQRLRDTEFQNFTCSIQYRLLELQGTLDIALDECLRLAMLAFLTTTFPMPGKKVRYPYLSSRFRKYCLAVDVTTPLLQDLMLWMLMVGAMSVYGVDEQWIHELWHANLPSTLWSETRQRLQDIMWINAIHDKLGEQAFEAMNRLEVF